ncbi:hypothetical protein D3C77_190350 [compost metagenome]
MRPGLYARLHRRSCDRRDVRARDPETAFPDRSAAGLRFLSAFRIPLPVAPDVRPPAAAIPDARPIRKDDLSR